MGRRGNFVSKGNNKRRVSSKDKGSDDSDEDFVLGEEEDEESDNLDEFRASSPEEFIDSDVIGSCDEEEIGRKVVRSRCKNGFSGRKKTRVKRSPKRIRVVDDYDVEDDEGDFDDDDEDFTLDGIDCVDEEDEELEVKKKINMAKGLSKRKKTSVKIQKRKRKSRVSNKPLKKKRRRLVKMRRASSDDEFIVENRVVQEKSKKRPGRRTKKLVVHSDSDFECLVSSDYDYTISEDEREQVREASMFCENLMPCSRSSLLLTRLQVDGASNCQQRKPEARIWKEKFEDGQKDVGTQVCGICFSEGKGTIRGRLNCCSHYFCFACIMEWSKVESRCPLCKQRFATIRKDAITNIEFDLRNVVIQVPKRDQVYQPSEEEVRGYLDPYENVVCIECHQGGDDGLMLLCDICDSPAHTYCVGLGREVPEGNWYCNGCRPSDPGSSNSQFENPMPYFGTRNINLPTELPTEEITAEFFAPTSQYSVSIREPSFCQGAGFHSSPRYHAREGFQAAPPLSGAGASTLSGRRRLHHQIRNLLSNNRMRQLVRRSGDANSESGFVNSEVEQGGETYIQPTTLDSGRFHSSVVENTSQDSASHAGFNSLRRQVFQDSSTVNANNSACGMFRAEPTEINSISSHEQQLQASRSTSPSSGFDSNVSSLTHREGIHLSEVKGQLQSMVKSHLKGISRDAHLGYSAFKDIARRSTHSILVACGLEFQRREAYPVQPPLNCSHFERADGSPSLIKDCCRSCFDSFVRDVVRKVMNVRLHSYHVQ